MASKGKPAELGDTDQEYRLQREEHPIPKNRSDLLKKLTELINAGGVYRLYLEAKKPILVDRNVPVVPGEKAEILESELPMPTLAEILIDTARNSPIDEYVFWAKTPPPPPHKYLFQAFNMITRKRLRVRAILVHDAQRVMNWLEVDDWHGKVFDVEVLEHKDLPPDAALVLGTASVDSNEVEYSVRIGMK